MSDIVDRLNENIIADAFESRAIVDGALCERLIRERKEAAETIEKLRAAFLLSERRNDVLTGDVEKMRAALEAASKSLLRAKEVTNFSEFGDAYRAAAAALKETGDETP